MGSRLLDILGNIVVSRLDLWLGLFSLGLFGLFSLRLRGLFGLGLLGLFCLRLQGFFSLWLWGVFILGLLGIVSRGSLGAFSLFFFHLFVHWLFVLVFLFLLLRSIGSSCFCGLLVHGFFGIFGIGEQLLKLFRRFDELASPLGLLDALDDGRNRLIPTWGFGLELMGDNSVVFQKLVYLLFLDAKQLDKLDNLFLVLDSGEDVGCHLLAILLDEERL